MPAAHRSRTYGIVATSVAVHAVLLGLVWIQNPRLKIPPMVSEAPEAVIPVLIMPRVPPPAANPGAKPTPIRLHRRALPFAPEDVPVAPLVVPTVEERRPTTQTEGPRTLTLPPAEDALAANARNALRSLRNCDNPNLTRAEREGCMDRFAAGGRDAPYLGTGIDREKAGALARAAAQKERNVNYRLATPPGTTGAGPSANGNAVGRGNNLPGATAEGIGKTVGSDNPTFKVPF